MYVRVVYEKAVDVVHAYTYTHGNLHAEFVRVIVVCMCVDQSINQFSFIKNTLTSTQLMQ